MLPGNFVMTITKINHYTKNESIQARLIQQCLKIGNPIIYNYLLSKGILNLSLLAENIDNLMYHLYAIDRVWRFHNKMK